MAVSYLPPSADGPGNTPNFLPPISQEHFLLRATDGKLSLLEVLLRVGDVRNARTAGESTRDVSIKQLDLSLFSPSCCRADIDMHLSFALPRPAGRPVGESTRSFVCSFSRALTPPCSYSSTPASGGILSLSYFSRGSFSLRPSACVIERLSRAEF